MTGRPAWHDLARCGGQQDLFYSESRWDIGRAKVICETCPVAHFCLAWALTHPTDGAYGVWGGTSRTDRRLLRKELLAAM